MVSCYQSKDLQGITGANSRPFFLAKEDVFINKYANFNQGQPQQGGNNQQRRPNKDNGDLVNERVRFPSVLLIGPNGEQLGTMSSKEAYRKACEYELDLYCVAPTANPPVCKLVNYGKFKFEQQKKAKESKKKQHIVEVKEIQLTPQTGQHDIDTKVRAATKFIEDGNKVKVGVRYRGRQMTHIEVGEEIMNKFLSALSEIATVEKAPAMDGKWLTAVLTAKGKK